jgi:hypothetical protein
MGETTIRAKMRVWRCWSSWQTAGRQLPSFISCGEETFVGWQNHLVGDLVVDVSKHVAGCLFFADVRRGAGCRFHRRQILGSLSARGKP